MRIERDEEKFGDKAFFETVSKNIAYYRKNHRNPQFYQEQLTQLRLAEEIKISRSLISAIESQKHYVEFSMAIVNRCSKVCCIPVYYYFLEEPPEEFYNQDFINNNHKK